MPGYNTQFELTVEDLDMIETALLSKKTELSAQALAGAQEPAKNAREIHDLLGRLHNQKVFYRPSKNVYVGG